MSMRRRMLLAIVDLSKYVSTFFKNLYYSLVERLPSGYQRVEYIESTGTQTINTGIVNKNTNKFEIEFSSTDTSMNRNYVIGGSNSSLNNGRTQFSYSNQAFFGWGDVGTTGSLNVNISKHKLVMQADGFYLDSILVYTPTSTTFSTSQNSWLFAMVYSDNVSSSSTNYGKVKIYSCKIYDNGTLVRNFIPCYRTSDNVIGLYDIVNNVFYTNAGTGTFLKGKNIGIGKKAKFVEYQGNSVVENQLVQNGNFESANNWYGYNGSITASENVLSYEITYIGGDYGSNRIEQSITHVVGHKYLIDLYVKAPYTTTVRVYIGGWSILGTTNANSWTRLTKIFNFASYSANGNIYFDVNGQASYQVGDIIQVKECQRIDLTQKYPFDTPTTLTDNRVLSILNRGYIPYNTGSIENTRLGALGSFDTNNQALDYLTFPATIELSGVGTAHNIFRVYRDKYEFTRNVWEVDLSTLNFGSIGNNTYYGVCSTAKNNTGSGNMPNIICGKYTTVNAQTGGAWTTETRDKIISLGYDTNRVYIRDTSITQTSDIQGKLQYQLATPQVISILKGFMGVVDLSKCTFTRINANRVETTISDIKPVANDKIVNVFCTKGYIANSYNNTANENVACVNNSTTITFYKTGAFSSTSTSAQIQELFTNIYMFYETATQTTDFNTKMNVEYGGTLTGYEFGWVENQLLNNPTPRSSSSGLTYTFDSSTRTCTINGTPTGRIIDVWSNVYDVIQGHKYLCRAKASGFPSGVYVIFGTGIGNIYGIIENGACIFTAGATTTGKNQDIMLNIPTATLSEITLSNATIADVQLIDLTQAFGAGNEPTSINDFRIQRIIEKGYIATNTTGIQTYEDMKVLPNVDFEVKAK